MRIATNSLKLKAFEHLKVFCKSDDPTRKKLCWLVTLMSQSRDLSSWTATFEKLDLLDVPEFFLLETATRFSGLWDYFWIDLPNGFD